VWLLIKKGADVTKHDNGRKPLYLALQNGSISMDAVVKMGSSNVTIKTWRGC
jgi:hypothetical protein